MKHFLLTFVRLAVLVAITGLVLSFAIVNQQPITLTLPFSETTLRLPLFLLALGLLMAGSVAGFILATLAALPKRHRRQMESRQQAQALHTSRHALRTLQLAQTPSSHDAR